MIKSWMIIGAVTFLVGLGGGLLRPKDIKWFNRLRRPRWLTFEALIPIIWIVIFICGAWSAYLVWESSPGSPTTWWLMAFYLGVEIVIVLYSPLTLQSRSLRLGTVVGGLGVVLGAILTGVIWQISEPAGLLLVPYLIWGPIGTYTTWVLGRLNPESV